MGVDVGDLVVGAPDGAALGANVGVLLGAEDGTAVGARRPVVPPPHVQHASWAVRLPRPGSSLMRTSPNETVHSPG